MKKAMIGVDAGGSSTKLALFLEDGTIVKRDLIVGHNGAVRAYGQKPHSKHVKLLRAYQDVVCYGKIVKEVENA